jgi:hypothetical protein
MFSFRLGLERRVTFWFVVLVMALVAGGQSLSAGIFSLDEGERLSEQIGRAAKKLQKSSETELTITYTPKMGVDQHYSVMLAKVRYQPHPPFDPPYPGLAVTVEKGNGGFCNAHVKYVGVPRELNISKYGSPTEVVLRKVGDEVDVVELR